MIELKNISKKFMVNYVIKDVSYKFDNGKIYGIRGRNGTGKTVLLKCICGLTRISGGQVEYNGKVLDKDFSILPSIGVIIESPIFWRDKTGYETLEFLASIKGNISKEKIIQVLDKVGLGEAKNMRIRKYSLGMRQRLAIAQAIMEEPDVLLLDEPTNSLDDEGVEMFKKVIMEEKERGATILIVSHVIEDVIGVCDEHLILVDKKLENINKNLGETKKCLRK